MKADSTSAQPLAVQVTSESRSLLKSILSYGTASSGTVAAIFLLHMIAGRLLGVEDYGRFSFAMTFAMMLAPLLDPGLYYLLIREVARDRGSAAHLLAHSITWRLLCAPAFVAIAVLATWFMHSTAATVAAVALMAASQVLLSTKDALRPILLAHEKFGLDALTLGIERVSLLVAGAAALVLGYGLIGLCWVYVGVRALDLFVIGAMVRRIVPIRIGRNVRAMGEMLRAALPIGAFYITLNVYNYVDTVMLSWLRGHEEVGWYGAAYRLYEGPVLIPAIIGTVFMPRLSRLYVENRERFADVLKQGIKGVVAAAVGIVGIGLVVAGWAVHLTYGPDYGPSVGALRVLLIGLLFVFTINFLQTVLISVDRQRVVLLTALGGLVANVAMNAVLIPGWGFRGAALATVIAEGGVCAVITVYVGRNLARK